MGIVAAVVAGLAVQNPLRPAEAEPALWQVRGPAGTVYLFGTMHDLRPGTEWWSPRLSQALQDSGELWVELVQGGDPSANIRMARQLGLDRAHPLSSKLSEAEMARLDAAAYRLGLARGREMLDPMRPWLAALVVGGLQIGNSGYARRYGVEIALQDRAWAMSKGVRGLETFEYQIRVFADLTPAQELAFLSQSLDEFLDRSSIDVMAEAWRTGRTDTLSGLCEDQFRAQAPEIYERLLPRRNRTWAAQLDHRLKSPGTVLVAVGACHLVGRESLQVQLAAYGYTAQRLNSPPPTPPEEHAAATAGSAP